MQQCLPFASSQPIALSTAPDAEAGEGGKLRFSQFW